MTLTRRHLLQALPAALAGSAAVPALYAQPAPSEAGTLIIGTTTEPSLLTSALTTAGPTQLVSGKLFDGLLAYAEDGTPRPELATSWNVSADGLTITFKLRDGVKWHDGQPFSSADVAYSVLEIWKKLHARGRAIFANVEAVLTPDAQTAVLRLSKPAPYILNALSAVESQVLPRHLYAGTDVLANPRNNAPVGTGPFKFGAWSRGRDITLVRNDAYWGGRAQLERIIVLLKPDAQALASSLEAGDIHLTEDLSPADVKRLADNPAIAVSVSDSPFVLTNAYIEFNQDRPALRNPLLRQAIAHAVDRDFLVRNVWHGYAQAADSPIPRSLPAFYAPDPTLPKFDLQRAEALLDQAGLPRDAQGVRLTLNADPYTAPAAVQTARYLRANLARLGIQLNVRGQDTAQFINRIYTQRDFDLLIYIANPGPDPVIGLQRFFWSKNFQPGVPFSNGAHYDNPDVDRLLEQAQVETDAARRKALYTQFQQLVAQDRVTQTLAWVSRSLVARRSLTGFINSADGIRGNFLRARLAA
ncbi:MAG: Oligopeptide-binding protein AppA [Paracidovorax wautersii]|uniref:Oligopeptide-binding protein AppA n=1 Tax=Paracidovorax wautersii TaxID=1177982 RepID=A0A7V8JS19_9BURK|nr:MAG: Oligopeptide-binding protein AppA [Paracidovorax wautersii]